jgi:hypothetical protein
MRPKGAVAQATGLGTALGLKKRTGKPGLNSGAPRGLGASRRAKRGPIWLIRRPLVVLVANYRKTRQKRKSRSLWHTTKRAPEAKASDPRVFGRLRYVPGDSKLPVSPLKSAQGTWRTWIPVSKKKGTQSQLRALFGVL